MKEYDELNLHEKTQVYNNAFTFLHDHADHVHSLFTKKTKGIAPSGSDMFKPELWKGIHWAWFLSKRVK